MEYRRLGRSGLRVSEIALGSWLTLGSSVDVEGTADLVRRAFDLGINFLDTADVYARGGAEQALARAIRDLPRSHLVIASKCFFPMSDAPNDRGLSRKHIVESVEGSLRRLGLDYLDLEQCHRPDPAVPMDETVRAFEDLIRQGKILYWGVSEWRAAHIVDACRTADHLGAHRPVSNQPQYSLLRRGIEREVLPVSRREGLGQVVWSPLAQGVLTGKYAGGVRPPESRAADPQRNQFMEDFLRPDVLAGVDRLGPLADECGMTRAELALAWCLREPGVSSVIVGATRREQLEQNAKASGRRLSADVLARVDALFPGPGFASG